MQEIDAESAFDHSGPQFVEDFLLIWVQFHLGFFAQPRGSFSVILGRSISDRIVTRPSATSLPHRRRLHPCLAGQSIQFDPLFLLHLQQPRQHRAAFAGFGLLQSFLNLLGFLGQANDIAIADADLFLDRGGDYAFQDDAEGSGIISADPSGEFHHRRGNQDAFIVDPQKILQSRHVADGFEGDYPAAHRAVAAPRGTRTRMPT